MSNWRTLETWAVFFFICYLLEIFSKLFLDILINFKKGFLYLSILVPKFWEFLKTGEFKARIWPTSMNRKVTNKIFNQITLSIIRIILFSSIKIIFAWGICQGAPKFQMLSQLGREQLWANGLDREDLWQFALTSEQYLKSDRLRINEMLYSTLLVLKPMC